MELGVARRGGSHSQFSGVPIPARFKVRLRSLEGMIKTVLGVLRRWGGGARLTWFLSRFCSFSSWWRLMINLRCRRAGIYMKRLQRCCIVSATQATAISPFWNLYRGGSLTWMSDRERKRRSHKFTPRFPAPAFFCGSKTPTACSADRNL